MRVLRSRKHLLPILTVALLGGCSSLIGLDGDYGVPPGSGPCTPGATEPCYTGPEGSESAAGCHAGVHVCKGDGNGYGECLLELAPPSGAAACACVPGDEMPCYSGPMETAGVGVCKAGTATCKADGSGFDGCMGDVVPAVERCGTPEDESCDGVTACEVAYRFAQVHGDNAANGGSAVAVDADGNAWVTGIAVGALDLGGGPLPPDPMSQGMDHDIFLLKLDVTGKHLFSARFGDAGDQTARSIAVDEAGNVYVLGDFTGTLDFGGDTQPLVSEDAQDVFFAAFSPDGKPLYSKRFGGMGTQVGAAMARDQVSGDLFLAGAFSSSVDFGGGHKITAAVEGVFVARIKASDGSCVWARSYGDALNAYQTTGAIAVDKAGDVTITGKFTGDLNFSGQPQDDHPTAGGWDMFVAKLKGGDGAHVWSKTYGDMSDQFGLGVATDNNGNAFVTGQFQGSVNFGDGGPDKVAGSGSDGVVMKLAPDTGNTLWARSFGSSGTDELGNSIAVDRAGNVVLLGGFLGGDVDFGNGPLPSQGNPGNVDFAVAKLDTMGKPFVARRFSGSGDQIGAAIAADSLGRIVMTGSNVGGAPNFGGGPMQVGASRSILVAGFSP